MNATHELKGCRVTTGSIIIIIIEEVVVVKVKIRIKIIKACCTRVNNYRLICLIFMSKMNKLSTK